MKKAIAMLLVFASLMVLSAPAYATSAAHRETGDVYEAESMDISEWTLAGSFTKNEYDMYLETQNALAGKWKGTGYERKELSAIQSASIEWVIQQRAERPEKELQALGYSEEKISILKEYDGGPLAQNPQLRGVFADLTGRLYVRTAGSMTMSILFTWTWSNPPVLCGYAVTDIVTCAFSGTNNQNLPCNLVISEAGTSCTIIYYDWETGEFERTEHIEIGIINPKQHIEAKFAIGYEGKPYETTACAKSGNIIVAVKEDKCVNNLYSTTFSIGYGHTVFTVSPSISLSVGTAIGGGVGLSFGLGTENMFYKHIRVLSDGSSQIYNGT